MHRPPPKHLPAARTLLVAALLLTACGAEIPRISPGPETSVDSGLTVAQNAPLSRTRHDVGGFLELRVDSQLTEDEIDRLWETGEAPEGLSPAVLQVVDVSGRVQDRLVLDRRTRPLRAGTAYACRQLALAADGQLLRSSRVIQRSHHFSPDSPRRSDPHDRRRGRTREERTRPTDALAEVRLAAGTRPAGWGAGDSVCLHEPGFQQARRLPGDLRTPVPQGGPLAPAHAPGAGLLGVRWRVPRATVVPMTQAVASASFIS